ncbi:MAG: hypothetical protein CVU41_17800 [Chloroflexi bacterium HGW-Chloroflexi-3]|nr:MAG: hypothetical protein CVU41_17800 [Chloroflexi bacterium HGW-Chloroflexi-3]
MKVQDRCEDRHSSQLKVYQVPFENGQSILDTIQFIVEHLDPTLSFPVSCRIGFCDSCFFRVNGKVVRSCTTLITDDVVIESYKQSVVIRDLVA